MSNENVSSIWYTRCPVPTPLGLAARQGLFDAEFKSDGITVQTLQEVADPALRESHYDHRLPHSFRQGGNVPAIWARSQGADTRVIGLNWVNEAQLILALPGSGIRTPADLRGKRLGLPVSQNSIDHARASALRGLHVALQVAGLTPDDATWVDIVSSRSGSAGAWANSSNSPERQGAVNGGYSSLTDALRQGTVDAIFAKGARGLETAAALGLHIVYDICQHPDASVRANNGAPRPITVDALLISERPDIVDRFLSRIVGIGQWAASHPAETVAYIARESGSTDEWVRKAYGDDIHLHQGTDLNSDSIAALEGYKNFLLQTGFISNDFSVAQWIDARPLERVLAQSIRRAA